MSNIYFIMPVYDLYQMCVRFIIFKVVANQRQLLMTIGLCVRHRHDKGDENEIRE